MRRSKIIRLVLVVIATAAMFAGIGLTYKYGVQPREPVWNLETPVWWAEPAPLTIGTDVPEYRSLMHMMVERVNKDVGCRVFRVVEKEEPMIWIVQGSIEVGEESEDWAAGAWVSRDMTRGEIVIYVPLMVGTDLKVFIHEAGHILGLAHDTFGAMKPPEQGLDAPFVIRNFSDKDSAALRARYCAGSDS